MRQLQTQVNNNVWWATRILGYSENKDQCRMLKKLIDHGQEVPEMEILLKDHKEWSPDSNKPVPSRPVVSGSRGINTHLSEWVSEFLEPIAVEMNSGEITGCANSSK